MFDLVNMFIVWTCQLIHILLLLQQIDEMLAGALTQEDEDAVLAELEAITRVGVVNRVCCQLSLTYEC